MSKMSQSAMELDEQAVDLGFADFEDALRQGWKAVFENGQYHLEKSLPRGTKKEEIIDKLIALRDDAADLAMGHGTDTDEWAKVALLADEVADYIKGVK